MIAIISDIHANLEALTVVIEDIEKRNVDTIVCLGDIALPSSSIASIYVRVCHILAGK